MADVTLAVGVPEEDVLVKLDGAGYNRDVEVPEEDVDVNQIARFVTEPREGMKEKYFEKHAAVRQRSRRWPQECHP